VDEDGNVIGLSKKFKKHEVINPGTGKSYTVDVGYE